MDDAEVEWRAHTTQIRCIEADTKKHQQEVLTTTNVIQDAIEKNNVIFAGKWEMTHNHINRCSEDIRLLKNWVVKLEALTGTGGKGSITQWVHAEYMVGSETICPTFTQQVRGGYFSKVPTKVPTG